MSPVWRGPPTNIPRHGACLLRCENLSCDGPGNRDLEGTQVATHGVDRLGHAVPLVARTFERDLQSGALEQTGHRVEVAAIGRTDLTGAGRLEQDLSEELAAA